MCVDESWYDIVQQIEQRVASRERSKRACRSDRKDSTREREYGFHICHITVPR